MAKALVSYRIEEGGPAILIETSVSEGAPAFVDASGDSGLVIRVEKSLSSAMATLAPLADCVLTQIQKASQLPKTAVVEFGMKFGAKGNVIIAGGEAEANCKITLTWDLKEDPGRGSSSTTS